MAAANMLLKLSVLLNLLSSSRLGLWSNQRHATRVSPPTCDRIECPSFDVVHLGDGYEIRRYNSTVWMSTAPIPDISLVEATRSGFRQYDSYIFIITLVIPLPPLCSVHVTIASCSRVENCNP